MNLIEFPLEDGGTILIESRSSESDDFVPAGNSVLARASESFEKAIGKIKPATLAIADAFKTLSPQELEIEFGLTLTAEAGVIISCAKSEVNFKVKMVWKEKE